jgi:hypothetical protein
MVTAYFLDGLAADRKRGIAPDRVEAVEAALQNLAEHLDLDFLHEEEISDLEVELGDLYDEAIPIEAAMAGRLWEKDPSWPARQFRLSDRIARLETKPSKWVNEHGIPTEAGYKAMFAAIDETK